MPSEPAHPTTRAFLRRALDTWLRAAVAYGRTPHRSEARRETGDAAATAKAKYDRVLDSLARKCRADGRQDAYAAIREMLAALEREIADEADPLRVSHFRELMARVHRDVGRTIEQIEATIAQGETEARARRNLSRPRVSRHRDGRSDGTPHHTAMR
ncbi:MAG TPA: hypothetical protein VFN76_10125 [Candidatus Limnocylindria bacterium]|nr:hypothetical protein [Candidatus Limnocylindria bacterium]